MTTYIPIEETYLSRLHFEYELYLKNNRRREKEEEEEKGDCFSSYHWKCKREIRDNIKKELTQTQIGGSGTQGFDNFLLINIFSPALTDTLLILFLINEKRNGIY